MCTKVNEHFLRKVMHIFQSSTAASPSCMPQRGSENLKKCCWVVWLAGWLVVPCCSINVSGVRSIHLHATIVCCWQAF
jgi:hypothetical protein